MSNWHGVSRNRIVQVLKFSAIALIVSLSIWSINQIGIAEIRANVEQLGTWGFLIVFGLRLTSVIIPALPGTAYSVLAGGLFGLFPGLLVICVADLISCSLSFYLSRRYGRSFITRLVGDRFINRLDRFSQGNFKHNFWLMTGFLMTGMFDFVAYGVGLTKTPWRKFAPALLISVAFSNPPIVALGAGLLESGKPLLGLAILGTLALGLISVKLQHQQKI